MTIHGRCHCGDIRFAFDGELPDKLTRCTCSFCAKRGALLAYCPPEAFRVEAAAGSDGTYRWNTKLVAHHFCSRCGIGVYSDSPAFEQDGRWDGTTRRIGINARLIDDFDAASAPVLVIDGKNLW
jgi:hypothetical protein